MSIKILDMITNLGVVKVKNKTNVMTMTEGEIQLSKSSFLIHSVS